MVAHCHCLCLQKSSPDSYFLGSFLILISPVSSVKPCSPCSFTMTPSWTLSPDFMASFFLCIVYLLLQISGANTVFDFLQAFSYLFYLVCSHNFSWSFVPMCLAKVHFFTLFSFTQPKCQMLSVTFSFECLIRNTNLTGFFLLFFCIKVSSEKSLINQWEKQTLF